MEDMLYKFYIFKSSFFPKDSYPSYKKQYPILKSVF